jgi:hypothetical protein
MRSPNGDEAPDASVAAATSSSASVEALEDASTAVAVATSASSAPALLRPPSPSPAAATTQGLTLVHFSAQLEPCLTHKNTLHALNTPSHPFETGYTTPTRTPYATKNAQVEL